MKYKSCHLLEHGIHFFYNDIQVCCFLLGKEGQPFSLIPDYNGEKIDWDKLLELKRQLRQNHKEGKINPHCQGCFNLEEREWEEGDYINRYHVAHWTHCNCNCVYCYSAWNKDFFNRHKPYKLVPILKEMEERNLITGGGYVTIGGGEATILDELDEIIEIFLRNGVNKIAAHSSGIKFNQTIANGLGTGKVELTVSIDSASPEMYKKIKQVDAYNKVIENLKKYVEHQGDFPHQVRSKYILIPGMNDDLDEIEKWIKTSVDLGIKELATDVEINWYRDNRTNIPPHVLEYIEYIEKRAEELGLGIFHYSNITQIKADGYKK